MGYDGSINIDTKINTSGMNKGTKSISSSLSGVLRSVMAVAKAMTAVFIGGSIISGIRSMIGQFDLMSSSIGGSIKSLSTAFDSLKGAFVNLLLTAIAPVIPYVITFVQWLTSLLNIMTQIIGALFGVKAGFGGVASSAGGAGKAAKKAGKDAQGALAAFDQINVLSTQDNQQQDTGGGGAGGGMALPAVDPISPEMLAKLEEFKAKAAEFFKPLTEALGRLYEALKPLGQTIWDGLKWAWDNILVPLGTWVVSDLLPAFLDVLSGALKVLNEVLKALAPLWQEFFDNFLKPLAEWAGGKIIEFLDWLAVKLGELAAWIKENPEKFQTFIKVVGALALALGVFGNLAALATTIATTLTSVIAFFGGTVVIAMGAVFAWLAVFALLIATIVYVIAHWEQLSTTVKQIGFIITYYITQMVEAIKGKFGELSVTIQQIGAIIEFYTLQMGEKIRVGFSTALDAVKSKFESIFTGIQDFVKGAINTIIGYINSMISNVVNGLNGVIGGLNTVGSVVPGFRAIATVSAPQIPRLATGAVIPPNAEFAAILGDQRSGKNIETPESLLRQIVRDESGKNGSQEITIRFEGSMAQLVRMLKPEIDRENKRAGVSLVTTG